MVLARWACALFFFLTFQSAIRADNVWTHLDIPAALVSDIAIDSQDPSRVYAATVRGVFKSVDGGDHWAPSGLGLTASSGLFLDVLSLSLDPITPENILAGTEAGIFRSTDAGRTWVPTSVGIDLPPLPVRHLERERLRPSIVYAFPLGYFYRSLDGGQTWSKLPAPITGVEGAIAIDQGSGRLFAATFSGVFSSSDHGETWSRLSSSPGSVLYTVTLDPTNPQVLFAGTADGVFKSIDGGRTWSYANTKSIAVRIEIDPSASRIIHAKDSSGNLIRSVDGGESWAIVTLPPAINEGSLNSFGKPGLKAGALGSAILFASGRTNGLFRSTDHGSSWTEADAGLSSVSVSSVLSIPGSPGSIMVNPGRLLRSEDGGATWRRSDDGLTSGVGPMAFDPARPNIVYAGSGDGIVGSTDAGLHWRLLEPVYFYGGDSGPGQIGVVESLAVDPSRSGVVYAGTIPPSRVQPLAASGVFRSMDGGTTWLRSVAGLP